MAFQFPNVETIYADDPKLKRSDIKALFEWLEKQPHLPQLTELQAILFLHSCYYNIETAKATIDKYFTLRTSSDLFECATEEVIRRILSVCCVQPLPKRTPEGDVVLMMKLLDCRPDKYVNLDHLKLTIMTLTLYFHQTGPTNGLIVLIDMKGTALGHVARFSISKIKQSLYFVQDAAPTRLKGIHNINAIPLTKYMMALLKPFVKKEIYEQIKFHSDSIDTLYEYIPKECLPQEYGGELPAIQKLQESHIQNLINHLDFFHWHDTQKVDESKRPAKTRRMLQKDVEESFKKLEID